MHGYLPADGDPTPHGASAIRVMEDQAADARRAKPVYVVDDDPWVRESLTTLLEAHGYPAVGLDSGTELLADFGHRQAGCVVVDQHMPGMDGLDTIDALRREGVTVPAILITGRMDANIAARAERHLVAVLEKPFPAARLVELVSASLGQP